MRINRFIFSMFFIFLCSCKEDPKKLDSKKERNINLLKYNVLTQFSLNYTDDLKTDSNSLIFYLSQPFDTSYVIQIAKIDTICYGVVYLVPWHFKKGLFKGMDTKRAPFWFEGYSFVMPFQIWPNLRSKIFSLVENLKNSDSNRVCADCRTYFISTSQMQKSGYLDLDEEAVILERYIRDSLVDYYKPIAPPKLEKSRQP
jgi:hypothetical protein